MIKLQILLRQPWRTVDGIKRVRELANQIGIKPTAEGLTTISAEISKDAFEEIFHMPVQEIAPQARGTRDFGRSGGNVSGDLEVPESLKEYVDSITVVPPHLRL
jgi:hypothetical protein